MAGEFLMKEAKKNKALIIPIDSEHCSVHRVLKTLIRKIFQRLPLHVQEVLFTLFQKINLRR